MVSYQLAPEQQDLRDTVAQFAREVVAPVINARAATQVFGGCGFLNQSPVGRFYRDAKVLEIGEGTSEIQRMLIACELGLGG